MSDFLFSDWRSIARILVVAPLLFGLLVLVLNVVGKHSLAKTNAYGLVVTVAIGSATASSILSRQTALADGVLAIALLLGLEYLLAAAATRNPALRRWYTNKPTLLLQDGVLQSQAMRRERVTEAEVLAAVRKQGTASLEEVGAVVLEADGSFSVIRRVGESRSALADVAHEAHAG